MLKLEADRFIDEVMRPLWKKWDNEGAMASLWCRWLAPYDWTTAKRAVEEHKKDSRLNEPSGKSVTILAEQYTPSSKKKSDNTSIIPEGLRFIYAATDCPSGPKAGTIVHFHLPEPCNDPDIWQTAAEQMVIEHAEMYGGLWLVGRGGYAAANRTRYEIQMEAKGKIPDAIDECRDRKKFGEWTREAPKTRSLDFRIKLVRLLPSYAKIDPEAAKAIQVKKPKEQVMAEFTEPAAKPERKFDVCPDLDSDIPF